MVRAAACVSLGLFFLSYGGMVNAESPFYREKTLTVLEGRSPGGTGSLRTQVAMKYLAKYLPGNPSIVYEYMPGAGGIRAVNHLANVAKRDGLTIGSVSSGLFSSVITGSPAIRFELDDLVFLGAGSAGNPTALVVRPQLKLDSVEKLKAYEGLRFGNRSVGHSMYIRDRLAAFTLELKEPQWVLGYGSDEIQLALERGEADAQFGGIPGFLRDVPHWFKEGYTVPVILRNSKGEGSERYPDFPQGRPNVDQFADTDAKKVMIRLFHATNVAGSMFYTHKEMLEPALKALKEAFNRVWSDPEFAEEYERITKEIASPVTGDDIHRALAEMPRDAKAVELYKQIVGRGPLPPVR
jgi:tripartite-type tricarboxylate transporter receptor subunit TctC